MNWKKLLYRIIPPCQFCPYKLGLVSCVENPCPQCKLNYYKTFKVFMRWYQKKK